MERKEIEGKVLKTYRLPVIDHIARYYNTYKYLLYAVILATITLPILGVHNFHWHWLLYLLPLEILFLWTIIRGLLFLKDNGAYKSWFNKMKSNPNHSMMYGGPPGAGKTLVATHTTYAMACGSWEKLQFEYFCLMDYLQDKNYQMTDDDKEIYEAYHYFIENNGVPCWGTNVPAYSKRYKRYSYKLGPSYLKQQRRAPFRLCGLYDEIGTVFNFELSNDKSDTQKGLTIADMARFCRQHAEFRFVGTEQEPTNMYKGIRNVVAVIREFTSFETIFKPRFLSWWLERMKNHFINPWFGKGMNIRKAKKWGKFLKALESFIKKVGFFKIRYKDYGRRDDCLTSKKKGDAIYLPCCADFIYDTRAFRVAYEARNLPIKMEIWSKMEMSAEEAKAFLRANYPKEKEEQRKKKT